MAESTCNKEVPIRQFLTSPTVFKFLSFGRICNVNASCSFYDASCDLTRTKSQNGRWYGVPMPDMFESGYEFLKNLMTKKELSNFSREQQNAWKLLTQFFKEKDIHEKNILSAFEMMASTEKSKKETILTMALAEHLFGKLSPGQSYLIDSRIKGKDNKSKDKPNEICKCGCDKEIRFGSTGIGHAAVWHGFVDILMVNSNEEAECGARVFLDSPDGDGPSPAKKMKTSDEEDEEEEYENILFPECISEVKLSLSVLETVLGQATAQTVVFALAYNRANPMCNMFIPNILICPTKFYIVMYEPVNDVLVCSAEFQLFDHSMKELQDVGIIALWMALHYKLFCKGAEDIFADVTEIKAGFRNNLDEEHWLIYKNHLNIGVSSFKALPRQDLVHSLREYNYDLPMLKN